MTMSQIDSVGAPLPPLTPAATVAIAPGTVTSTAVPPATRVDLTSLPAGALAPSAQTQPPAAQVRRAVQQLNQYMQVVNRELNFTQDQAGTHFVQVIDPRTQQVLRQIPDKAAVALAEAIDAELMAHLAGKKA